MQAQRLASFLDGLRAFGYVDGQTIAIEYRWAEGRFDRLPALAAELVGLPVDLLVTAGPPAVRAAQQATTTIPIVVAAMHEPITQGFVASLARPAGNITGQAFQDTELSTKRLDCSKRRSLSSPASRSSGRPPVVVSVRSAWSRTRPRR